jgi:hypothetical protein
VDGDGDEHVGEGVVRRGNQPGIGEGALPWRTAAECRLEPGKMDERAVEVLDEQPEPLRFAHRATAAAGADRFVTGANGWRREGYGGVLLMRLERDAVPGEQPHLHSE